MPAADLAELPAPAPAPGRTHRQALSGQPGPNVTSGPEAMTGVVQSLAALNRLLVDLADVRGFKHLVFTILNRTVGYLHYDRAVLFDLPGGELLGVSGTAGPDRRGSAVTSWRRAVRRMRPEVRGATEPVRLDGDAFDDPTAFEQCAGGKGATAVAWLPICIDGVPVAALWLERWGPAAWSPRELAATQALRRAIAGAWRQTKRPARRRWARGWTARAVVAVAVLAVLALPVPVRIVAPCEVVPRDPATVTTRIDGVIDRVIVRPGQHVEAGDVLAELDKSVAVRELEAARRQLRVSEADLQRAQARAFADPDERAALALLRNVLERDRTRLAMARYRLEQSDLRAPEAGTVLIDDVQHWQGRPVRVGEQVMLVVRPERTRVRIDLPLEDRIDLPRNAAVDVILHAEADRRRTAQLTHVARMSRPGAGGTPCFRAEAAWADGQPARIGLTGSAVLRGDPVPLAWWLLRRPVAGLREVTGW